MSLFKVTVELSRTVKMMVRASDVPTARRAAIVSTETAFANALEFWGDPLSGDGMAQISMPSDGMTKAIAVNVVGEDA
jgi:hypothetical protein